MKISAIACGRFQPFHNDHLEYLLSALSNSKFLWIGITKPWREFDPTSSSHRDHDDSNPYTFIERFQMIRNSLIECGISLDQFCIIPFDFENSAKFAECAPPANSIFVTITDSWSHEKIEIFKRLGFDVEILFTKLNPHITGTRIRSWMNAGDPTWERFVPPAVRKLIKRSNNDV